MKIDFQKNNFQKNNFIQKNRRVLGWVWQSCPEYILLSAARLLLQGACPYISIYLSARIVTGLTNGEAAETIIRAALILVALKMALSRVGWMRDKALNVKRRYIENRTDESMVEKSMTMDYQVAEQAATQELITRISEGNTTGGGISSYVENLSYMMSGAVSAIYAFVLMLPFFFAKPASVEGGLSAFLNSGWGNVMFAVVLLFEAYSFSVMAKRMARIEQESFDDNVRGNRVFWFFCQYTINYALGKGVRIYDMYRLIRERYDKNRAKMKSIFIRDMKREVSITNTGNVLMAAELLFFYVFIGARAITGAISIGNLTFYVGVATSLMTALRTISNGFAQTNRIAGHMNEYIDFLAIPNEKYDGTLPTEKRLDNEYELELRDVSFHYPNSSELALSHVSMKIRVGGKLAVVGKNGSGKSTFIKLLTRLYDPTEGEILLNGIDIRKYDYDEYRRLFSVVFQDFALFSFPIAQNVAAGVECDRARMLKCLEQAGLSGRVNGLERGIDSVIYKQGDDDGVEISGGEAQKIAIARALYKNAPIVILDEPTAALDPASELEVYERFDEMVDEKTAIYISHRMSSCRFCEQILVFDNGGIAQIGSHESLLADENGLYASLWNAQARYYQ